MSTALQRASTRSVPSVPRLALTKREAAAAIGCSVDFLEEHVQSELRVVRRGRLVLIPVAELERWLRENAALTVETIA